VTKLFIPQEWVSKADMGEVVRIDGDTMIVASDGKQYRIEEALHVVSVEGGDPDAEDLLGKVVTHGEVKQRGGEQVGESLIMGETAYRVEQGFVALFEGSGSPVSEAFRG